MGTESEQCVDESLIKLNRIDYLLGQFELNSANDLVAESRTFILETSAYIENNKSLIPGYILKKLTDSLKKLENRVNEPDSSKLQEDIKVNERFAIETLPTSFFGFRNKTKEQLVLLPADVLTKDVTLLNLEECNVVIQGLANTIYIRNLKDTTVIVCLACRAITLTNCRNCKFKLVCQQLRIDYSHDSLFEIYTSARSMLESSTNIRFKPINLSEVGKHLTADLNLDNLFEEAKFDADQNNWKCIDDFDWLVPDCPSKNFTLVKD